jgi:hypothetical protein
MTSEKTFCILALVPPSLCSILDALKRAAHMRLVICFSIEELVRVSKQGRYAVVLLPSDDLASHEWWSLWGAVSLLDPRPSILVYALKSDFRIWAGVLAAGGFDVITAPFTQEKFSQALHSAEDDFHPQSHLLRNPIQPSAANSPLETDNATTSRCKCFAQARADNRSAIQKGLMRFLDEG